MLTLASTVLPLFVSFCESGNSEVRKSVSSPFQLGNLQHITNKTCIPHIWVPGSEI